MGTESVREPIEAGAEVETASPQYPKPWVRARGKSEPEGVPLRMAGGETWKLAFARTDRVMDATRDAIFDNVMLNETIDLRVALDVAFKLLRRNYRLSPEEVMYLMMGADRKELAEAVWSALFAEENERRTYSGWMRASFIINGIDPDAIHPEDVGRTLDMLVSRGLATALGEYSEAAEAAGQMNEWRAIAMGQKARQDAQQPAQEPTALAASPAEAEA